MSYLDFHSFLSSLLLSFRSLLLPSLLCASIAITVKYIIPIWRSIEQAKIIAKNGNAASKHEKNASYQDIEPLPNFNWRTTPPLKLRPFKSKFHLTMALENTTISELVPIDSTYLTRIHLRRSLLSDPSKRPELIAALPSSIPAISELYTWLFGIYLPRRYPTLFRLDPSTNTVTNIVTSESIPLAPPSSPTTALHTIGSHVDNDFLFLLPSTAPEDQGVYKLIGYITCFPSGFSPLAKLDRTLAQIHGPVPGYPAKLERSMDRFFAGVQVGKVVKRANWTVTETRELCLLGGTHIANGVVGGTADAEGGIGKGEENLEEEKANVDLSNVVLRCERQTLHRLEESGALVFAFKTYQYELSDVKEEIDRDGERVGEQLAKAVEGLGEGSVREMGVYKRGVVWGEKVASFLRG